MIDFTNIFIFMVLILLGILIVATGIIVGGYFLTDYVIKEVKKDKFTS